MIRFGRQMGSFFNFGVSLLTGNETLQLSLFKSEFLQEPRAESWSQVVARRMQSLVMSFPIQQMVAKGESGYYPDWGRQNFTFLALQVFDSVFARMAPGIGQGATREEIIEDIKPYILKRQPELSAAQIEGLADFILGHLMNEGKGSFEQECIWVSENQEMRAYPFRYGLLTSYHHPESDQFIIRATKEAIHIYLRMLDQPLEDEQIANLFILHEQVRRGRISQSRKEAERTMLLSLEYERYIDDMLRSVRRDVRGVDWVREVSPKIEEAQRHVKRLIRDQGQVLSSLKQEQRSDRTRFKAIQELLDILETCQRRHMELQGRILSAGPAFLEEQAYQRFRSMARSPMPDLNQQIFLPALNLDDAFFYPILPDLLAAISGPQIHRIMDLEIMLERFLREDSPFEQETEDEHTEARLPVSDLHNPLNRELEERVADILSQIEEEPIRLSKVLEFGRLEGLDLSDLSILGVTFLQSYHARSDVLGLTAKRDGQELEDCDFMGDDLILARTTFESNFKLESDDG